MPTARYIKRTIATLSPPIASLHRAHILHACTYFLRFFSGHVYLIGSRFLVHVWGMAAIVMVRDGSAIATLPN
jgi:hypothetical protein